MDLTKNNSVLVPKQRLFAPMLGTFGGGSIRGFAPGGAGGLDVSDVFSTDLYTGAGDGQTITNDIDLANEGGLVWGKCRNIADGHFLVDSERGKGSNNNFKYLRSDTPAQEVDTSNRSLSSFNSDGFTFQGGDGQFNSVGNSYVSWTFRKAPKFFDVVTYTGDGSLDGRSIPHSLGCNPGFVVIKRYDSSQDWIVGHTNLQYPFYVELNTPNASGGGTVTGDGYIYFDSTTFSMYSGGSLANNLNTSGASYVAYIFAHNNGDGEFGASGDQDIIKCGSYTGNGSSTGPSINLGFEPQWLLIKNTDNSNGDWFIHDNKRDLYNPRTVTLFANTNDTEYDTTAWGIDFTSTGFQIKNSSTGLNGSTNKHIYVAIRAAD